MYGACCYNRLRMQLTIAFITGRPEPHLEWLLESLAPQVVASDEIHVLVIDALARSTEDLGVLPHYGHWVPNVHVSLPKPTPWQGAHRITTCDWWAKSSAMNTALVLCETDYIAFVDDCCRVGPKWLETVRRGKFKRRSVLAGTYDKIEHGGVTSDHRRAIFPQGRPNCGSTAARSLSPSSGHWRPTGWRRVATGWALRTIYLGLCCLTTGTE